MKISLNNRNQLMRMLNDKFYADHFQIYDLTNLSEKLENMSNDQYYYFKVLLSKKKWFDIKNLLDKFINHK